MCMYCVEHEPIECNYLKTSILSENFLIDNVDVVSVLRCLIMRCKDRARFDEIMQLESHCVHRKDTDIWSFHQKQSVNPLRKIGLLECEGITDEQVQRLCGILDVNSFEIRAKHRSEVNVFRYFGQIFVHLNFNNLLQRIQVRGLYAKASLLAHDCVANTFIALDENQVMKIYASTDIMPGGTIFYNYTDSLSVTYRFNQI